MHFFPHKTFAQPILWKTLKPELFTSKSTCIPSSFPLHAKLHFWTRYCHLLMGGIMGILVLHSEELRRTSWRIETWEVFNVSLISPQHSGRFYEELPNTADYVSYRLACNKEDYPEPYSPPINPPLTFLPQHPYHPSQPTTATTSSSSSSNTTTSKNTFSPPSHTTAIFKYPSVQGLASPPPGVAAYTFPKEQYVWTLIQTRNSPLSSDETAQMTPEPYQEGGCCLALDFRAVSLNCLIHSILDGSGSQKTVQLLSLDLDFSLLSCLLLCNELCEKGGLLNHIQMLARSLSFRIEESQVKDDLTVELFWWKILPAEWIGLCCWLCT